MRLRRCALSAVMCARHALQASASAVIARGIVVPRGRQRRSPSRSGGGNDACPHEHFLCASSLLVSFAMDWCLLWRCCCCCCCRVNGLSITVEALDPSTCSRGPHFQRLGPAVSRMRSLEFRGWKVR